MAERNDPAPAAVHAGAVALGIPDFAHKPVTEQTSLRAQLEALAGKAIEPLPDGARIVADAANALAVVVLEDPGATLALAERARAAAGELPLRIGIGIGYGPITAVEDAARGTCLIGDGLAVALTLARAASPGRTLASRPFRDALAATSPYRAKALRPTGVITDQDVRSHEVFEIDPGAPAVRRRQWAAAAATMAAAVLSLGVIARSLRPAPPPPVKPAVLQFEIKPRGEIYLDGSLKGPTPPLAQLEVSPGSHAVEVRNGAFPPLRVKVHLAAAEEITIRHTFVPPKPRPAPPRKKPKKEVKKEPKKEEKKEAKKEAKQAPAKQEKKEINWGDDIKQQYQNVRRKLGL